jgi:hypothetical protein
MRSSGFGAGFGTGAGAGTGFGTGAGTGFGAESGATAVIKSLSCKVRCNCWRLDVLMGVDPAPSFFATTSKYVGGPSNLFCSYSFCKAVLLGFGKLEVIFEGAEINCASVRDILPEIPAMSPLCSSDALSS